MIFWHSCCWSKINATVVKIGQFLNRYTYEFNFYAKMLLQRCTFQKYNTLLRITNFDTFWELVPCDFFIMIWVAVRMPLISWKAENEKRSVRRRKNRKCNCIIENLEKRVGNKNSFLVISLFYKVLLSRLVCYSNLCVSKSKRVPRIMLCWWGQLFGSLITSISPFSQ